MTDPLTRQAAAAAEDLFDRYALPKVALTVILAASLAGTWASVRLSGGSGPTLAVAKWAYFVALGVLTGGLLWKHAFVRADDLGADGGDYCAETFERFDRIARAALAVLSIAVVAVVGEYAATFDAATAAGYGALVAVWIALAAATTLRSATVDEQHRHPAGLAALALAVAVVAATAVAEVSLRGFEPVAAGVRVLHLLAFAAWIGGAVWNIFAAVPAGKERPTLPVVRAAGQQLERFRWVVRMIIPAIVLTGVLQAVDALGLGVGAYLSTGVGLAVLAKLGFIGALAVIFVLCPMWRACSPIEGVCELDDLGDSSGVPEGSVDD